MSNETTKFNVLMALGLAETTCFAIGLKETAADLRASRAAVVELIEASRQASDEMYHAVPEHERFTAFQDAWGRQYDALKSIGGES